MATLVEFRAQNPAYNDMPDAALADALHSKFYSDIPKPQFYKQLGITSAQIPGAEKSTTLPPKPVSMQDRIMAQLKPLQSWLVKLVAWWLHLWLRCLARHMAAMEPPQGKEMGQQAAQVTSQQFYQPRTETGPDIVKQ
jgi:hypothetical protein